MLIAFRKAGLDRPCTMSAGVPLGAPTPRVEEEITVAKPSSLVVGHLGQELRALGVGDAPARGTSPDCDALEDAADIVEGHVDMAAQHAGELLRAAVEMDDAELALGRFLQHQDGEMVVAQDAGGAGAELAGVLLGRVDQVGQRLVGPSPLTQIRPGSSTWFTIGMKLSMVKAALRSGSRVMVFTRRQVEEAQRVAVGPGARRFR